MLFFIIGEKKKNDSDAVDKVYMAHNFILYFLYIYKNWNSEK